VGAVADRRIRCSVKTCRRQFTPARGTRRTRCYECSPEKAKTGSETVADVPTLPLPVGEVERSVRARLEVLGDTASLLAVAAVRLAQDIDATPRGKGTGPMVAQLIKTMEPLERLAPPPQDEVSEFEQRAAERRRAAGG
jgi:hypothetical protein